ncbi:hypothetical protein B0H13DRAFT_1908862 [Mycena leptocephala]|nr:hypothetical protein B0H13DRAFT_1908862 [Mycena leptocephala]
MEGRNTHGLLGVSHRANAPTFARVQNAGCGRQIRKEIKRGLISAREMCEWFLPRARRENKPGILLVRNWETAVRMEQQQEKSHTHADKEDPMSLFTQCRGTKEWNLLIQEKRHVQRDEVAGGYQVARIIAHKLRLESARGKFL